MIKNIEMERILCDDLRTQLNNQSSKLDECKAYQERNLGDTDKFASQKAGGTHPTEMLFLFRDILVSHE